MLNSGRSLLERIYDAYMMRRTGGCYNVLDSAFPNLCCPPQNAEIARFGVPGRAKEGGHTGSGLSPANFHISSRCGRPGRFLCAFRVILPSGLLFDFHAAPEGNVVSDFAGGGLRIGVIPCRVLVFLAVYHDAVVAGEALPGAG